jgi:Mg/Co/Ni transporter MgtE
LTKLSPADIDFVFENLNPTPARDAFVNLPSAAIINIFNTLPPHNVAKLLAAFATGGTFAFMGNRACEDSLRGLPTSVLQNVLSKLSSSDLNFTYASYCDFLSILLNELHQDKRAEYNLVRLINNLSVVDNGI